MKTDTEWLTKELESEVIKTFQPLYRRELTKTDIKNIANSLADTAELWIKFNWRITHAQ